MSHVDREVVVIVQVGRSENARSRRSAEETSIYRRNSSYVTWHGPQPCAQGSISVAGGTGFGLVAVLIAPLGRQGGRLGNDVGVGSTVSRIFRFARPRPCGSSAFDTACARASWPIWRPPAHSRQFRLVVVSNSTTLFGSWRVFVHSTRGPSWQGFQHGGARMNTSVTRP